MSFSYIAREGFSGFRRTRLASMTSVTALVIAVFMIGLMARFGYNAFQVVQVLKQSVDVEVFLLDIDERRKERIESELRSYEIVEGLDYISKEMAESIFREEFGAEGESLADLNFLPASFKLQLAFDASSSDIYQMVKEIEQYQGVDEVVFNRQLLETIEERMEVLAVVGAGMGLFILFAAVVLVFNTIRLTIYAKRNIIKTMKLVGATNGFIRRPFYMEGLLQGLVAATVAIVIHWLIFQFVIPYYIPQFGVLSWPFERWYYLTGVMAGLSILMGLWGSRWATKKFISHTSIG